ncbi:MAG: hypothetical protein ABFC94_01625 [Syntrophomonas sp.]
MILPFEVDYEDMIQDLEPYVSAVFSSLESDFMTMPRGNGFVDFPVFEQGYEALKLATRGFQDMSPEKIFEAAQTSPMVLIILRSILGFTPPEWAYIATQRTGTEVTQGFARALDRTIRLNPAKPLSKSEQTVARVKALITAACQLITSPFPSIPSDKIHRLDKADTRQGLAGLKSLAGIGVPYSMLLYERFLGRPFAGHRDSVSDLIGDSLEAAIEELLFKAGISYRKTKRAEKIAGFDQTPDFIIPSEFNPQVVIEAKITEDDGTARDKVTRIQHLGELSAAFASNGKTGFEVIACIGGRGFGVRREDMKKMLIATRGKVFTLQTLDRMIECTRLGEFKTSDQS